METEIKRYRCTLCAWDYVGESEQLRTGLCWEELPINWQCPSCGAYKQDFEPVNVDE